MHAPAKLADDLSRRFSQMIEVHKMLKLRQWDDFIILCNIINTIILYEFIHSSHMHAAAHIQTGPDWTCTLRTPCKLHPPSITHDQFTARSVNRGRMELHGGAIVTGHNGVAIRFATISICRLGMKSCYCASQRILTRLAQLCWSLLSLQLSLSQWWHMA